MDTAERLVAPRYYGHDEARMHDALETMGRAGHEFLVAPRAGEGGLRTLRDVAVPGPDACADPGVLDVCCFR